MGICPPDMNSCVPKCKQCGGVNDGKVYNCESPCSCYSSNNINLYSFNGYDCVKEGSCGPMTGTFCAGTIGAVIGFRTECTNTGPGKTTPGIFDTTPQVKAILGTQNASPFSTLSYLYHELGITSNSDPDIPVGYGWITYTPFRVPTTATDEGSFVFSPFGGDGIRAAFFFRLQGGGITSTGPSTLYWFNTSQASCVLPCCGCTPCTISSGCPGPFQCCPVPASSTELYGSGQWELKEIVAAVRWINGANAATSVWTRL
jgi:hypothetical protein